MMSSNNLSGGKRRVLSVLSITFILIGLIILIPVTSGIGELFGYWNPELVLARSELTRSEAILVESKAAEWEAKHGIFNALPEVLDSGGHALMKGSIGILTIIVGFGIFLLFSSLAWSTVINGEANAKIRILQEQSSKNPRLSAGSDLQFGDDPAWDLIDSGISGDGDTARSTSGKRRNIFATKDGPSDTGTGTSRGKDTPTGGSHSRSDSNIITGIFRPSPDSTKGTRDGKSRGRKRS
jgi:hypothetical protein